MLNGDESEEKTDSLMNGNSFEAQLFQCVAYVTHKCPLLQKLFLEWVDLSPEQRLILNLILYKILPSEKNDVYTPILSGFHYWNVIQDTEGACGYHDNPLNFKITMEDEKKIYSIIVALRNIIHCVIFKQIVGQDIANFNITKLKRTSKHLPGSWGDK